MNFPKISNTLIQLHDVSSGVEAKGAISKCQLASSNQLPLNWPTKFVTPHLHISPLLHSFYIPFSTILLLASLIYAYIQSLVVDSIYKLYSSNSIAPHIFRREDNKTILFIITFLLSLKIYLHITNSSQLDSSHINKSLLGTSSLKISKLLSGWA